MSQSNQAVTIVVSEMHGVTNEISYVNDSPVCHLHGTSCAEPGFHLVFRVVWDFFARIGIW